MRFAVMLASFMLIASASAAQTTISAMTPDTLYVDAGSSASFTVFLSENAPVGGSHIVVSTSSGSASAPADLYIPEGMPSGEILVQGVISGQDLVTATLAGSIASGVVIVQDPLLDSDGDGLTDADETGIHGTDPLDPDSDNDGLNDGNEINGTGTDPLDADIDDDGLSDGEEVLFSTNPGIFDTDNDLLGDGLEVGRTSGIPSGFSDGTGVAYIGTGPGFMPDQNPATRTDPLDPDSDNDGLLDGQEDPNRSGSLNAGETNPVDADYDDDGLRDGDEDLNGNGVLDQGETEPRDSDTDDDVLGDGLELGVSLPVVAGTSGGTYAPNRVAYLGTAPGFTGDAEPSTTTDPRNPDSDADGLTDGEEDGNHNGYMNFGETNPMDSDTDNDGLIDGDEVHVYLTDPLDPDSDDDSVLDGIEINLLGTDPRLPDSDADGIGDGVETDGGNPVDTDNDGIIDALDDDSDDDGYADVIEGATDSDGDLTPDYRDLDSDDDGVLDSDELPVDSDGDGQDDRIDNDDDDDGIPTLTEGDNTNDADSDGIPNYLDLDSDDDGFLDSDPLEGTGDDDGDGIPNFLDPDSPAVDTDGDGLYDALEASLGTDPNLADSDADDIGDWLETDGGQPVDTDDDGIIDALDLDSDDDGIEDAIEGPGDSDLDGVPDYRDPDDDGDGILTLDEGAEDVDSDGIPNYLDTDSDGDGYSDADEAGSGSDPYDPGSTPANLHDPVIGSVTDVGNDQGRRVRISWLPSDRDAAGSPEPILSYSVYRRIDGNKAFEGGCVTHEKAAGLWDFVLNLPASGEVEYHILAETLCDSTDSGVCWSVFFVRAHTAAPTNFFDSDPDSGYSVDNLAPGAPQGLAVAYGTDNTLDWDPSEDLDFRYFKIYRGAQPGFTPEPDNLVQTTIANSWVDGTGTFNDFYLISAVDFAGNEGPASAPGTVTGVGVTPAAVNALHQNTPNPFNPKTTISFSLAHPEAVTLTVHDVSGRLMRTLVDGKVFPAGNHLEVWNGTDRTGRQVSAGVYIYRVRTNSFTDTRRMTLVK